MCVTISKLIKFKLWRYFKKILFQSMETNKLHMDYIYTLTHLQCSGLCNIKLKAIKNANFPVSFSELFLIHKLKHFLLI